jgi:hypothetical protein
MSDQRFTVFQRLEMPHASSLLAPMPSTVRRSEFQWVATVMASSPEEAFQLTNQVKSGARTERTVPEQVLNDVSILTTIM